MWTTVFSKIATVVVLLATVVLSACASSQPLVRHVELHAAVEPGSDPASLALPYVCQAGTCNVSGRIWLDERDLRGASLQQEGETTAVLQLDLSDVGRPKWQVAVKSNPGRRLALVQDGEVLAAWVVETLQPTASRLEVRGNKDDLQLIFDRLTKPKTDSKP